MTDTLCASCELEAGPLIDPVSGAYTLEYLARHLEGEIARSQRHGHSLSVLHCEIGVPEAGADELGDPSLNYSALSDSASGDCALSDSALSDFACQVAACIRKEDWLIRVGSTAFKIILPETNTVGAECAARKIHERFADLASLRIDVIALEPHRRPADATALAARLQFQKAVIQRDARRKTESHFTRFLNALTAAAAVRAAPPPS